MKGNHLLLSQVWPAWQLAMVTGVSKWASQVFYNRERQYTHNHHGPSQRFSEERKKENLILKVLIYILRSGRATWFHCFSLTPKRCLCLLGPFPHSSSKAFILSTQRTLSDIILTTSSRKPDKAWAWDLWASPVFNFPSALLKNIAFPLLSKM